MQERLDVPRMIVEISLGHKVGNDVEAAYDRGDYVRQQREVAQLWSDYLDELATKVSEKNKGHV